jgi:hypothetical protein
MMPKICPVALCRDGVIGIVMPEGLPLFCGACSDEGVVTGPLPLLERRPYVEAPIPSDKKARPRAVEAH